MRPGEAIAEIRRAYELDPLSLIIGTAYGRVLHFARRYDEAIVQLRRTLEMDPAFHQAHFDLGMAFAQAGRHDDALAERALLFNIRPLSARAAADSTSTVVK